MSGHTPGPWHPVVREGRKDGAKMYVVTAGALRRDLCHVLDGLGSKSPADDCRLIAAAPDLLAVAKACADYISGPTAWTQEQVDLLNEQVHAAIARAQGIQS